MTERPAYVVLGRGLLADAVTGALSEAVRRSEIPPDLRRPVVTVTDSWDVDRYPELHASCAAAGVPWIPVHVELGRVVIGPVAFPGVPGCYECAEFRRRLARADPRSHEEVWRSHRAELAARPSLWLTGHGADLVSAVVAEELEQLDADPRLMRTRQALLYLELDSLHVARHRFLPDPLCPRCGVAPADAPALAAVVLVSRPKRDPRTYRIGDVGAGLDRLLATYVDDETGLIRRIAEREQGSLPVAGATVGLRSGGVEYGFGRTRDYRSSRTTALLEALERYGGVSPGGRRTSVHGTYRDLADRALDPRQLGFHPEGRYDAPGSGLARFREDDPIAWVWCHSFARDEPVLVPESYAYYGAWVANGDKPLVYETSNGCALGGCLEEAILHGVLEVAERDAFLMTWYANLPVPRVDLGCAADRSLPLVAGAMEAETGYQVLLFDITREHGVPSVWAMALDPARDGERPAAVCAAAAHLDPERAAENALNELGHILADRIRLHPVQRDLARRMADDPALVTDLEHHVVLYGDPLAAGRLDFLLSPVETREVGDLGDTAPFRNADLRDDLNALIGRYLARGMDVVVVDQSTPEHRAGGFSCVKVIIPGMLPMTFGHALRRVDGLPRLRQALAGREPNPHPHPFP
uniref:TOMM precursor leader peptide-binding protein n=1 Tax=Nonomuraea pusilla TaxID=46177 RepID=UPI0006E3F0D1|nr:TOMM precursor leader peptide-binding protein [Nonomuraea pusilla]